jgi:hypothetical protein
MKKLFFLIALTASLTYGYSQNKLSPPDVNEGWELLFDGETTNGWRRYNGQGIGSSWKVENGALVLDAKQKPDGSWYVEDGGDIVTEKEYSDFIFEYEWKISPCGNSGVMFLVKESPKYGAPWMTGPEMQILDNTCHPDAEIISHRAGDLYDILPSLSDRAKPAGEWNQARIRVQKGNLKMFLNGELIINVYMWNKEWDEVLKNTKWKDYPDFAKFKRGRIALQDHKDARVEFRNMKIKNWENIDDY